MPFAHGCAQVVDELKSAIHQQRPCSFVRLGDGELLTAPFRARATLNA
ncbi:hypothetical protein [Paenibacillus sp. R14(2021)]